MDRWKIPKNNFNKEDLLKSSLDILLKKETVSLRVGERIFEVWLEREIQLIEYGNMDGFVK